MSIAVRAAMSSGNLLIGGSLALCVALGCDSKGEAASQNGNDATLTPDSSLGGGSGGSNSAAGSGSGASMGGSGAPDGSGVSDGAAGAVAADATLLDAGCPTTPCGSCCCGQFTGCGPACAEEVACMQKCVLASGQPYNTTIDQQCRANCGNGGALSAGANSLWTCETGDSCKVLCLGS